MCILFVYANPEPEKGGYRLIVASNRDEYYSRPALNVQRCPHTDVIAGRDMEPGREGGTWLGISLKPQSQSVKFAALLNVTGAPKSPNMSAGRGPLVVNYLESDLTGRQYSDKLPKDVHGPFNLFTSLLDSDHVSACHHSNAPPETIDYDGQQFLAFGNSTPSAPLAKVTWGKDRFQEIIQYHSGDKELLIDKLIELLKSRRKCLPDAELERRAPDAFEELSSCYVEIHQAGYGTRAHSIVLVDADFNVEFIEHAMRQPIVVPDAQWDVNRIRCRL